MTPRLNLRAGVAYAHGRYTDFKEASVNISAQPDNPAVPNNPVSTTQDWTGNQTIRTPEWTANLGVDYSIPLTTGKIILAGNVYYTSQYLPSTARENPITGKPVDTSGPYAIFSGSVTWAIDDRWGIALYGRNLSNERYVLARDGNAFGDMQVLAEPRVVGLRVDFKY